MAQRKQGLRGAEALSLLESSASRDLKRTRELVEEASMADMSSYFKGADLGELSPVVNAELVSAAIAGGQWGFNTLVSRLTSTSVHEADYEHVANEILEIVSLHAKILNYARFRATAIQSYVAQCSGRSVKLQSMNLSKSDIKSFEDQVALVQDARIWNLDSLQDWINEVDDLCTKLSERQESDKDLKETSGSRGKKGSVSTKSISSYSKHWQSYAPEIISQEISIPYTGDKTDSIATRTKYLVNYQPRNWAKLQRDLSESKSTRRIFHSAGQSRKKAKSTGKQVTAEHDLGGRLLSITYNLPGVDVDLIQPALNSIRAQLMRNVKQGKVSFTMKSDSNLLSIEMDRASKDDLETLRILLNSHKQ